MRIFLNTLSHLNLSLIKSAPILLLDLLVVDLRHRVASLLHFAVHLHRSLVQNRLLAL